MTNLIRDRVGNQIATPISMRRSDQTVLRFSGVIIFFAALFVAGPSHGQTQFGAATSRVAADEEQLDVDIPLPTVEETAASLEIKVGKSSYRIDEPRTDEADRVAYESLPLNEQLRFASNRKIFLATAARALHLSKYGFGIGSIVKEKIVFIVKKIPLPKLRRQKAGQVRADGDAASPEIFEEKIRSTLKERSDEIALSVLRALDRKLWIQAPLFANSNEFGIMAAGGLEILGGKSDRGWGGLLDFGVSIGYNRESRSLVIQIFNDFEHYRSSAMPAIFLAGLVGKAGLYIMNEKSGALVHEGTSFYPPLAPAFSSMTTDSFTTGFSTGLTWPPSPLGDLLTYTNRLDQSVLLRMTISPLTKGFVRVHTGLGAAVTKVLIEPVSRVATSLERRLGQSRGVRTCTSLFRPSTL